MALAGGIPRQLTSASPPWRASANARRLRRFGLLLALVAAPLAASADEFADGLAAYDAGDYASAVEAWEPLAAAGDADALTALAGLHDDGLGVPQNHATAAAFYRRAAELGHVIAQIGIGEHYRAGHGVPRDPLEAYVWFGRAAAQGNKWAAAQRDRLAPTFDDAARAAADQRIAQGDQRD